MERDIPTMFLVIGKYLTTSLKSKKLVKLGTSVVYLSDVLLNYFK